MSDYQNFTSLSPDLERQFVPFERRTVEAGKKAWQIALSVSAVIGVITLIVVLSFDPPKNPHAEAPGGFDAELSGEEAASPEEAPAPAAEESEEATEEAEAEESAEEADEAEAEAEAEEGDGDAPAPPPGATKAPPTDLVD